jgi:hypothetical protein
VRVTSTQNRPVIAGFVALATGALVLGLLGAFAVMMGVKVLGVGGDSGSSSGESTATGLYLPEPPTPTVTESVDPEEEPSETEPTETTPAGSITLNASQTSVSPMQQIDLTGSYPAGEGAILQVQRMENGEWQDFPVTMSVSGGTFSTYVMTSRSGDNTFRVIDTDSDTASNEVTITVG